ncbi:MAG: T9SS type A sorting domain-containing protein [bacterium]
MRRFIVFLSFGIGLCFSQYYESMVANTSSFDATAFNNSHKIAVKSATKLNDSIYVVYHSSDSLFYIYSTDEGYHWQSPIYLSPGRHPAIDLDRNGMRHIAYESPDGDIYYDCLNDYSSAVKVNVSNRLCAVPDLVIDSNLVAHIVWEEEVTGKRHIYYRNYSMGSFSDTMRLSSYGSVPEDNSNPSISIFGPNKRIFVVWTMVDSSSYTPFHIMYRYMEGGNWSPANSLSDHYRPLRNVSLDYSHGNEVLSASWEDSSSGNLEARFYGGNAGGGYPTAGLSSYPVVSTVGTTWSYLFWNEDSSGYKDIYYHLYYTMTGWYARNSIRNFFLINESIRFPNTCGAYVIWTQGDAPPYKIYFANFGYPIGISEMLQNRNSEYSALVFPDPFRNHLQIRYQIPGTRYQIGNAGQGFSLAEVVSIKIYDISGRLVKSFNHLTNCSFNQIAWSGDDDSGRPVPAGVYLVKITDGDRSAVLRVVKIE